MIIKSAVKKLCDIGGVNDSVMRFRRSDLLVLCYHSVVGETRADRWSYDNSVDREAFREQIRWLKRVAEPTDLAGLRRWQAGKWSGSKGPVLITFDDGYRNNLTEAAPVLKAESVPAIFFLTTGYIGTSRTLWNDEVRLRVVNWPGPEIRMPSGEASHVPLERQERRGLADRIAQSSKRLDETPGAEYLDYLRSETPAVDVADDPEARAFMSWDEARQLNRMGFEIGAHTVEHPILSRVGRSRVARELRESKATIERELECSCTSLAYPNGTVQDVTDEVAAEAQAAGFERCFMTTPRWQRSGEDPYRTPRICVPGHADLGTYKFYVSGLHSRLTGPS